MYGDKISIDTEKLRKDMVSDSMGAFFGGGYGGAMLEANDVKKASDDDLIRMAERRGVNLNRYKK